MDETADSVNEGDSDASQQTTVSLSSEGSESKAIVVSGMPAGQIVLIVLAVGLVVNLVESNMVSEDIEVREVNVVDTAKVEECGQTTTREGILAKSGHRRVRWLPWAWRVLWQRN